jgi:peptidoglycan/xylan/chitin deacetylase (PgdA/CDA1 family)
MNMKRIRGTKCLIIVALLLFVGVCHAQSAQAATNLVPNPSVEIPNPANPNQPQNWITDLWGTTKATFSYATTGHTGSRSVKTQITKAGTGDAKWYFNEIPVTAGQAYLFSDYWTANIPSRVTIQYHLKSGSYQYKDLGTPAASANWQQFQKSFVVPTNVTALTVFHLITASGTLSVDDYSLTLGTSTPNPPTPTSTPAFNFSLSNDGSKSVMQGQSATASVTATLSAGMAQPVSFSTSGLPAGTTAAFSSPSCTPTCSLILTLQISTSTPAGISTITVTGTAATTTRTTSFSLTVNAAISTPTSTPISGTNIIPNNSVESSTGNLPTGWVEDSWGTNTTKFTYLSNSGHTGSHSVRVQMTKYTNGDAKWHVDPIAVTPGDTYNFSDWYQSNVISHVVVDFTRADGTDYYVELRAAPISTSTWAHYSESFPVILDAKTVTVYHMIEGVGSLTVDDESLVKFIPVPLTRPDVTIMFDNGFEDNIGNAIPTLDKYGFKVTYCYSTEYVEGQPSQVAIVQAITSHGEETCSHSIHHSDMTLENSSTLTYELVHSQQYLQSITGQSVRNFISPFGAYNDTVVNAIRQVYRSHRTTDEGYNTPDNFDQYRLLAQNMNPSTTMAQYESYIQQTIKDKSWLVLVYHRIATSSLEDFDTPYADFDPQMSYLKNSGAAVLTMDQALDEIIPQIGQ